MSNLNQTKGRTYQFLVTIDSERELRPQDLMEAFESSESIRLDEDFVAVTVAAPEWVLPLLATNNSGATAFTVDNEV